MISNRHIEVHPLVDEGRAWPPLFRPYFPAFYLDVGGRCNFACPYCSIDKSIPFRPPEELERIVEIAGRQQLGTGIFIGGEPSIYPDLERVMEHGLKHGVSRYWIISNGSGFVSRPRVERLRDLGMKVWHLSWDHFDKRVLASYHGTRPVLANLLRAADNLQEAQVEVAYVYQVVTRQTFPTLPQMVDFVADLRERLPVMKAMVAAVVKAVQEALVHPEVLYPLEEALPSLREGAAAAERRALPFWIFNLPPCVLPELEPIVFSPYELDRTLDLETMQLTASEAAREHCTKDRPCLACARFESCSGYLRSYEERFGNAIFRPAAHMRRAEPVRDELLLSRGRPMPPETDANVQRLKELLERFSHDSWRVSAMEWDAFAPLPRWVVTVVSVQTSADAGPVVVHLEPANAPSTFLRSTAFSLSYPGSSLPKTHEAVMRALFGFLSAGACVV